MILWVYLTIYTGRSCYRTSKCSSYCRSTSRSKTVHSTELWCEPQQFFALCLKMTRMQLRIICPHRGSSTSILHQPPNMPFLTKMTHIFYVTLLVYSLLNLTLHSYIGLGLGINPHLYLHSTVMPQKLSSRGQKPLTRSPLHLTRCFKATPDRGALILSDLLG